MLQFLEEIFKQPLEDFLDIIQKFLPNILTSMLILVFGFLIAWIVRIILGKIAKLLKVENFLNNTGIARSLKNSGIKRSPIKVLRRLLYWTIVFIFATMALIVLKVPAMENLLERFFLYLPNVFIAVLLLVIGYLAANFVGRVILITQVNAGLKYAGILSKTVKFIIIIFAFAMAVEQLGIGRETILIAFSITFGGIVLALALAIGFGGKDIAREFLEKKFKGSSEDDDTFKHM
jgi:small-conductance mechanosensitive channel